ncbi:hypothetical protein T484DRAFT_1753008 [Baffinella frigidus]|nr:hypothetical protein T484DRAFT_1753008 [Cryptophyta sp. CCMP2293]
MVATARLLLAAALPAASAFALIPSPSLALRPPAPSTLALHGSHLGVEASRRILPGPRPSSRLGPSCERTAVWSELSLSCCGTLLAFTRSCRSSLPPPTASTTCHKSRHVLQDNLVSPP